MAGLASAIDAIIKHNGTWVTDFGFGISGLLMHTFRSDGGFVLSGARNGINDGHSIVV